MFDTQHLRDPPRDYMNAELHHLKIINTNWSHTFSPVPIVQHAPWVEYAEKSELAIILFSIMNKKMFHDPLITNLRSINLSMLLAMLGTGSILRVPEKKRF